MITIDATCIVPTVFRADVECYGEHEWCLEAPHEFEKVVCCQMQLLCGYISEQTLGLQLLPKIKMLGKTHIVTSIRKFSDSRVYRIEDAWLNRIAPKVQGVPSVFYIWIPLKQKIFKKLPKKKRAPYLEGNRFWFPCCETNERKRKRLRKGVPEELMHWIKATIARRSRACLGRKVPLTSPDKDKGRFWREFNSLLESEDPQAIRRLFGLPSGA